ncbi:MAG: 23S rRNA (uracil(1939)-C(5))-methyltransferase RlmD [Simkaniaceae bacterium]|nr:23S rRNA (uracil(1939)-C(5))-methyltransferase RlmD [Simkaniaceae bacterium]
MKKVLIDRYSKKGHGAFKRSKNEIVGGLVGEELIVDNYGKLLEILQASPHRVPPRCPHVGSCGGCSWQHMRYLSQLQLKQERVESLFQGAMPILSCDDPFYGRNKMEFSFSEDKAGQKYLGLMMPISRGKVLNLKECHLVSSFFTETLQRVRHWWEKTSLKAFHPPSGSGSLRNLIVREGLRTGEKMVILTVNGDPEWALKKDHIASLKQLFDPNISLFLKLHTAIPGRPTTFSEFHLQGPTHIHEEVLGKRFMISPDAFFQPNTHMAEKLYQAALDLAKPAKDMVVFDLFSGTGTLGILFAPHVKQVISIEINPYAVFDAEANAELQGVNNLTCYKGDVGVLLPTLQVRPDLVLLDPPRMGIGKEAIQYLLKLRPERILYISCNVATQKEDIEALGYQIEVIQPVDQFPHTPHIENIILLRARESTGE